MGFWSAGEAKVLSTQSRQSLGFCNSGNGGNICNFQRGIAGRFKPDQSGFGVERLKYIFGIGGIHIVHFHPEFFINLFEKPESAAINIIHGNHFVADFPVI